MTDLTGKIAIVTGAGRGIGKAIAMRLGKLGAQVVVNDYGEAEAAATVAGIEASGGKAIAVAADVSKVAEIDRIFTTTLERFGKVDIVVANAGLHGNKPVLEITEADYDRLFAVNAKGSYFTVQRAARHVADNGRIIFIGSSTSRFALPGHGLYGASKVSTKFLVGVVAKEVAHRGVTANTILPTVTVGAGQHTEQMTPGAAEFIRLHNPMQRPARVEDVADACEYLVSDLAGFVSGQELLLSGGGAG